MPGSQVLPVHTDIHSHILPGIDDGAPDLASSLQLIRGLYALGIKKSIATPHIIGDLYRNNSASIHTALATVQDACKQEGIDMEISAAAEYMLDDYFMELLQQEERLLCLQDNTILTEFSYTMEPQNIEEMAFGIITAGYKPILAHPERYFYFHRNYDAYYRMKELGFHLQVNLLSLTGYYGKDVHKAARFILKHELASLVGTDLHHDRHLRALRDSGNLKMFGQVLGDRVWNDLDGIG